MDPAELLAHSTVLPPSTYWTLSDALALIRGLQPQIKPFGFHLCLGGGVLNTGSSRKDLDLYFLPLDDAKTPPGAAQLKKFLSEVWQGGESMRRKSRLQAVRQTDGRMRLEAVPAEYPNNPNSPYTDKLIYIYSNLRIDVFILGMRAKEEEKKEEEEVEVTVPTEAAMPVWQAEGFASFGDWLHRRTELAQQRTAQEQLQGPLFPRSTIGGSW
jgi:hypothetical protein